MKVQEREDIGDKTIFHQVFLWWWIMFALVI